MQDDQYEMDKTVYDRTCVVCGKSVTHEEATAHLQVENGEMIALCCPLCFGVYEKNPERFLALRALRTVDRKARQRSQSLY